MDLFASDLDNTLIYSYKHDIGLDKIAVETKGEKKLSFMTKKSIELLKEIGRDTLFVPVTTRSMEQYRRIHLFCHWIPEYALVANGGILLHQNKEVTEWYQESLSYKEEAKIELEKGLMLLSEDPWVSLESRMVDSLFLFTKSDNSSETRRRLEERLDPSKVEIRQNGEKIYILPKKLNKGKAIERFKKLAPCEKVIAAGDSEFDIPMLNEADISMIPKHLEQACAGLKSYKIVIPEDILFSEGLLEQLKNGIS